MAETKGKKKKKHAEPEMGYCPFEHWLGRMRRLGAHGARARGWVLGVGMGAGRACERGVGARGKRARRAGLTGGTGTGAAGRRPHGRRAAAGTCARGALKARLAGRQARGLGAGRAAWARGLAMGCALGALGLFLTRFDSVLFLNQFLDIVREPGS